MLKIDIIYDVNLRDLKYLQAVAKYRHFGQAAEACHVSQPTLSMQLKKLEEYLGVSLFERGNRQVMLTPVGAQILEQADELLRRADAVEAIARASKDPLAGEFRLGAFPTLAPYVLPLIVPEITKKLPKLRLLLIEEKTARLV